MKTGIDKPLFLDDFRKVIIFRALSPIAQEFLFDRAQILEFEAGEKIVEYGDLSPSFFAVLKGKVHVARHQDGRDVYIDTLEEGTVFGEAAMFLRATRTADVVSADGCTVVKLTRFDLMDFIDDHPRDGNKILLALVYGLLLKLRSSSQELVMERHHDAKQEMDALVAEIGDLGQKPS